MLIPNLCIESLQVRNNQPFCTRLLCTFFVVLTRNLLIFYGLFACISIVNAV